MLWQDDGLHEVKLAVLAPSSARAKLSQARWERAGGGAMLALRCAYRCTGGMAALARRDDSRMAA